jgi:hypothetical protein
MASFRRFKTKRPQVRFLLMRHWAFGLEVRDYYPLFSTTRFMSAKYHKEMGKDVYAAARIDRQFMRLEEYAVRRHDASWDLRAPAEVFEE